MRRIALVVFVAFGLWLLSAIVTGLHFAAGGSHGAKLSVILVSVGLGTIVLGLDALLIRRVRNAERRSG